MKEFRSINIDAGELVRSLGRLGELRERARPIEGGDLGRPLPKNELRAVWPNNEGFGADLPSILLGSDKVLGDLLPRMLALPGAITPVTSLMRAWRIEDFRDSTVFGEKPLSDAAALGFVGLIMGELMATIGPDIDLRLMGMDGVRRTLSFVCARAIMKGWRKGALSTLVERWHEASALTANEVDVAALARIANMCRFLDELSSTGDLNDSAPLALAHQVQAWIDGQSSDQRDLLPRLLTQVAHTLTGVSSREKRYDVVMEALDQSRSDAMRNPLEQGFLISLIEPGSFEFLDLAKRADLADGSVAVAYCLCAMILGKEAALRQFNGFGWTVFNHGLKSETDGHVDVSLAELRILHNARRITPILFRTRSPWLVDVELAPMVAGSFGNVAKRRASPQRVEDEPGASEREEFLRENLATALRALESAYGLVEGKKSRHDSRVSVHKYRR